MMAVESKPVRTPAYLKAEAEWLAIHLEVVAYYERERARRWYWNEAELEWTRRRA